MLGFNEKDEALERDLHKDQRKRKIIFTTFFIIIMLLILNGVFYLLTQL